MSSAVLLSDIDAYAARLRQDSALLRAAREGRLPAAALGRYLQSIHYLLLQTPVHLRLAVDRALAGGAEPLARYFDQKLAEEVGHHHWAEADLRQLESMGLAETAPTPAASMVELVEGTRRAIERDPHLYLGYILFAEYFTVVMGPEWLSALEQGSGVPRSAMSAIGQHVELDKHHVREGCEEIDGLIDGPVHLEPLRGMLRETMRRFDRFCEELCQAA